jgi:uncharacterized protein (TIGR00297 family)
LTNFLEATVVIAVVGAAALAGRFLDLRGAGAAAVLGYMIYIFGGRMHFLLLLVFFIVSGFSTRYRYREKYGEYGRGVRTWSNVISNGLAAALIATAGYFLTDPYTALPLYIGAVSAVFADTMSTELGLLSKRPPILITSLKRTEPGTPGGVTPLGLMSAFVTGFIISVTILLYTVFSAAMLSFNKVALVSVFSGFTGSLFDSVVGGLVQSRYRCTVCGRAVEVKKHCGKETLYLGGSRLINNDLVNLLTSFYGAFSAYSLWVFLG